MIETQRVCVSERGRQKREGEREGEREKKSKKET